MRQVQLRDAKANLSALVDDASHGEASIITRHGKAQAVLVGMDEWNRLSRVPTFAQFLMSAPLESGDLAERDRSPPRDNDF